MRMEAQWLFFKCKVFRDYDWSIINMQVLKTEGNIFVAILKQHNTVFVDLVNSVGVVK